MATSMACPCVVGFESESVPFAAALRRELAPRGALETFVVEQVLRAALRLEAVVAVEPADAREARRLRAGADFAQTVLLRALDTLDALRARRPAALAVAVAVAAGADPEVPAAAATVPLPAASWRERLVIDPEVSDASPVVRGTWITVAHVVSLIVDGWSWADILRDHPELTEDDIRACLAYTVEQED